MEPIENWIWLPVDSWPDDQTCPCSGFAGRGSDRYTVAQLCRTYTFPCAVREAKLRFSGDTLFVLRCNGHYVATGPACVGGDFLGNDAPRPQHYATEVTLSPGGTELSFDALVQMTPVAICDYSQGHGGFMLTAHLTFADGTVGVVFTDRTWQVRRLGAYVRPGFYDGRIPPDPFRPAAPVRNLWHTATSPLPPLTQTRLTPTPTGPLTVLPGQVREEVLSFDRIYAGYLSVAVKACGEIAMTVCCFETDEAGSREEFVFCGDQEYRGMRMHSAGGLRVRVENRSGAPAQVTCTLIASCYPASVCAHTVTSDAELNRVLDVCVHTLKYCRQSIHLDSPRHCEPLACTGDYYIETLMTAFSFGDMRLAAFDVRRTAELLRYNNGRMFHTSYSLIWVQMLWDVYMLTGERALLSDCADALVLLLGRFSSYIGENGLIEEPPDYMFVDWLYVDGISLHHPPKALGQTCLNLFYFGALRTAARVFTALALPAMAERCRRGARALARQINRLLYDPVRGLYFEGLNTPTPEHLIGKYMPRNTGKRYYRMHANILAAYFGVCDRRRCVSLLHRVMGGEDLGDCQPYFMHYLLEAISRCGLREQYTRTVLERWKTPVAECPKGLAEGFLPPEPSYHFDHSHAWGGTPAYALPKALLGFEMLSPGFRRISLSPSLLGLKHAVVEMPSPQGMLRCEMKAGRDPVITLPPGITAVYR